MSISKPVVSELLRQFPNWRPQMYFKSSLTALSHAMEDRVLAGVDRPLVIASFQKERFYRQEAHRYQRIADRTDRVYVLAAPETEFKHGSEFYETIAFSPEDALTEEWHLIVIGQNHSSCLVCRERSVAVTGEKINTAMDASRRFEGIWTLDRQISIAAAEIMFEKILYYRPELAEKIALVRQELFTITSSPAIDAEISNADPFVQRLVTYLQAGQYKLLKANKSLSIKEQKERLLNSVSSAIRLSLNTEEILQVAVQKLGEGLGVCRCLVYRCRETDATAKIDREFNGPGIASIEGQNWQLKDNPLFQEVVKLREPLTIDNALTDPRIHTSATNLKNIVYSCSIFSWLLVPVLYQGKLLGMLELHHCGPVPSVWKEEDVSLVNAVATQVGVALMQAEAYANLEELNEQLEALDRTRSNLVAITGHELRTPLSTIRVCLESLATEPDMPPEMRQVMLSTALQDAERMRKLIQDFLTLSEFESGRIQVHPEALSLRECVDLAVSNSLARNYGMDLPQIDSPISTELPLVKADGEWLVEVLVKLLDNACKFTERDGTIAIEASIESDSAVPRSIEITVSDTGRGIEPNRLEKIFDRFYQEEGALRRSAGGTGLGLAICRQIVQTWGGKIWAESAGKDRGSQFHFTIPVFENNISAIQPALPKSLQQKERGGTIKVKTVRKKRERGEK
jgi:DICT domain-containing protein/signal transduction histidine kinase